MSGHNRWSKIKHKKAVSDAKKSKVFSKLVKLIQIESKKAGGDLNSPILKAAIEKAKKGNVPKENIVKAVKKGASGEAANLENALYEAYGPGGVGIMIETLTDNKNRTGAEIKSILSKNNANLGAPSSVSWAFEKINGSWEAKVLVDVNEDDTQKLEEIIELLEDQDDVQEIYLNAQ